MLKSFPIIFLLFSCTVSQEPEFVGAENIQVLNIINGNIKIGADLLFHNPNDIGCNVEKTDIKASVNGIAIGKVSQQKIISLEANKKFKLPIVFSFSVEDILSKKEGLLSGLFSTLLTQSVEIVLDGTVTLNKLGFSFDVDLHSEEKIKVKIPV